MKNKPINSTILVIFTGLIIGILLKLFVFDILHISGHSMEPNLNNGDSVIVNKLAYGLVVPFKSSFFFQWAKPKNGDVVIFLHDNKIVCKRVCATEGCHLDFSKNSGYSLIVQNKNIELTHDQFQNLYSFEQVPQDYVLVLGDNMQQSVDSRDYGFVSVHNITGKIIGR